MPAVIHKRVKGETMRCRLVVALVSLTLVTGAACSRQETEAEKEAKLRAARADSVALADSIFEAAVFDTITWESPEARMERGGVVWRASCEKCHGGRGRGDGEAAQPLELEVPSFLVDDWEYAEDFEALRRRIYTGTEGGMPHWAFHGLGYRNIDAVVAYVDLLITPDQ
jgi:mono/diheme cytochrome c family protein